MSTESSDGGIALFRLVRHWSRRWSGQVFAGHATADAESRRVQHIQTVEAVAAPGGHEPTVTTVAAHLGIDHSGASRMVRDAVAAGYLERAESTLDRRRVVLRLSASGRELLDASHDWQRRCFDELTASWSARDRRQFAGYLRRLADETSA